MLAPIFLHVTFHHKSHSYYVRMKCLISLEEISFYFVMQLFYLMFKPLNTEAKQRQSVSYVCAIFIMFMIEGIPIL